MHLLGINWLGLNAENLRKLGLSLGFILAVVVIHYVLRVLNRAVLPGHRPQILRARFWVRQGIQLFTAILGILGLISIWFDNPARLATAFGLVTAGIAFALQRVITAFAGYFVILRGQNFTVGDRITMGGVRGDVVALSFIQTQIMEMGQPERGRRRLDELGEKPPVHRPHRQRQQRQDLHRSGVQLHARLPLYLGRAHAAGALRG